jgi:hypothetical protein
MSLEQFKHSAAGRKIAGLLGSDEAIRGMERKSSARRPAIEAIGKEIEARVGVLDDQEKKLVGRWVKEVLVPRGWQPDRKARVAAGHFFSRGTIYRRSDARPALASGAARLAAVRALVRKLPEPPLSVDEFLAERRKMWGE